MASENRCPKCNTPMETFSMILWDGSPHVEDACPLLDHDCLIKSLGRQLEEAKAVALASMERGTATDEEKCELARQLAYSESTLRASEARERELQGKLDAAEAASEKDERDFLTVIDERDACEEVIGEAYQLVMDEWPEWSSDFGFTHALDAMNERLGADMRERESLKSERDEARSQLNALEEQLLSVLPEDFGAVEYIKSLESQLRASQERELALRSVLDEVQDYLKAIQKAETQGRKP